jgi:hypothetical protein
MGRWLIGDDGKCRRLRVLTLVSVGLLGALSLPQPLWANQATFALFSSEIVDGEVLYKGIIDLKQPGVFIYYLFAQLPFGRNAVGIHAVELITWLGFGWILQRQAVGWFRRPWMAATLPLPVIGTYFLAGSYQDQTQVEALVNIPMLAAVMLVMPDNDGELSRRRAFLAGVAMAVVGYLKLPYVAIPLAVSIPTLVAAARRDVRNTVKDTVVPALAGAAVLVVPFFIYFAITDAYSEIYELYFEYSRERNELFPRPTDRLGATIRRTIRIFSPFIAMGGLGLALNWRALTHRRAVAMVVWAVVAVPLFLVQQWWTYHAFLWLVPATLFAWFALEAVLDSGRSLVTPIVAGGLAVVAVLFLTQIAPDGADKVSNLVSNEFAFTQDGRDQLRRDIEPTYSDAQAWSAWNQSLGAESSAWGIGVNPNFLFVAGQEHDLSTLTWPLQLISGEIYDRIAVELTSSPPRRFIVHDDAFIDMQRRAPATLDVIERDFCVALEAGDYNYLLQADDPNCP